MNTEFLNTKCNSNQTYIEFIRESEAEFNVHGNFQGKQVEDMTVKEIEDYINWLDYLWDK